MVTFMLYKFCLKHTYIYIANRYIKVLKQRVRLPFLGLSSLHWLLPALAGGGDRGTGPADGEGACPASFHRLPVPVPCPPPRDQLHNSPDPVNLDHSPHFTNEARAVWSRAHTLNTQQTWGWASRP